MYFEEFPKRGSAFKRLSLKSIALVFQQEVDGKPQKGKNDWSKAELEKLGRELVDPIIQEAQKSLDEGVVASPDLVDAGMIFGTGFAPFRGGPLYFKDQEQAKSAKAAA